MAPVGAGTDGDGIRPSSEGTACDATDPATTAPACRRGLCPRDPPRRPWRFRARLSSGPASRPAASSSRSRAGASRRNSWASPRRSLCRGMDRQGTRHHPILPVSACRALAASGRRGGPAPGGSGPASSGRSGCAMRRRREILPTLPPRVPGHGATLARVRASLRRPAVTRARPARRDGNYCWNPPDPLANPREGSRSSREGRPLACRPMEKCARHIGGTAAGYRGRWGGTLPLFSYGTMGFAWRLNPSYEFASYWQRRQQQHGDAIHRPSVGWVERSDTHRVTIAPDGYRLQLNSSYEFEVSEPDLVIAKGL